VGPGVRTDCIPPSPLFPLLFFFFISEEAGEFEKEPGPNLFPARFSRGSVLPFPIRQLAVFPLWGFTREIFAPHLETADIWNRGLGRFSDSSLVILRDLYPVPPLIYFPSVYEVF